MYTIKLLNVLIYTVIGNSHSKVPLNKIDIQKEWFKKFYKIHFPNGLLKRASTDGENSCKLLKSRLWNDEKICNFYNKNS